MQKILKSIFSLFLSFGITTPAFSQSKLLDSAALANTKTYTSIAEAMKNPDSVIKLVLRKQKLKEFPPEIFKLTKLQYLDLGKNKIVEIPKQIDTLSDLQVLILSVNKIESLPSTIGNLQNLWHLNLSQNEISLLPNSIGNLHKLERLDLWSNNIVNFPEDMKNLKNLKFLDLRVILMNTEDQDKIKNLLPHTNIQFDPSCNCKY